MKRKVCVAFVMSLALMAAAGCVSESMTALSDRVFDRAAEQFVLMDSNLAEGEFPRSLDTLGNLVTSDSKWWCCGFFPGAGEGFQTRDIVIGEGEEYEENLKAMNENRLSCTINISYGDFDYHSGGDIQGSSANSTRPWRNVEKFVGEFIGETDVVLANHAYDSVKEQQEHSFIGYIGKAMEPVLEPLGFDWRMGVGIVAGVGAKELVVSTLGVMYAPEEPGEEPMEEPAGDTRLQKALLRSVTPAAALA